MVAHASSVGTSTLQALWVILLSSLTSGLGKMLEEGQPPAAMSSRCLDVTVGSTSALKENRFSAKQDPYAVIKLGEQEHRTTSNAYERTRPVWNHRVSFSLPSEDEKAGPEADELVIDIYEYGAAKDKHIGYCKISLANVKEKGSVDVVQPVYRKSGKLLGHLRFHLAILEQQIGGALTAERAGVQKDRSFLVKDAREQTMRRESNVLTKGRPLSHGANASGISSWATSPMKTDEENKSKVMYSSDLKAWQSALAAIGHPGLEPFVQPFLQSENVPTPTTSSPAMPIQFGNRGIDLNGLTLFPLKQGSGMTAASLLPERSMNVRAEPRPASYRVSQQSSLFPPGVVGRGEGQTDIAMSQELELQTSSPSAYVIPISYWQHLHAATRQGFAPYMPNTRYEIGPAVSEFRKVSEQGQQHKEQEGGESKEGNDSRTTTGRETAWRTEGSSFNIGGKRKANSGNESDQRVDYIRSQMPQLSSMVSGSDGGDMSGRWQERLFFG